jgi:hypothetical protein
MKNFRAADKSHAGGDEKHDINFHWPNQELGAYLNGWSKCKMGCDSPLLKRFV